MALCSVCVNTLECIWQQGLNQDSEEQVFSLISYSVQFSSIAELCPTLCDPMDCSTPGFPVHHQLPELVQTLSIVSDAIQPSQPLWSSSPASIFPSITVFSNESALHIRWPQYWNFSFSISPSNEYSGLISFKIDLFDLLAVQGTLKSLLQHHSSKASICQSRFDAGYRKLGAGALG